MKGLILKILLVVCLGFTHGMVFAIYATDGVLNLSNHTVDDISKENKKDSVEEKKTKDLQEIVVEGVSRKETENGVIFYPTGKEKKFSYDAVSLLERMALPELIVLPGSSNVETVSGEPAAFFINGVSASSRDLKALNPKDVARVEYLPVPTDANFKGQHNVVNFVLRKYEYGGYTKAVAQQQLTGIAGDYNISSRFAYKRMTYDAFITGQYASDRHIGASSIAGYKDFDFSGKHYDIVEQRSDLSNGRLNKHGLEGSFKAAYAQGGIDWVNTIGVSMTKMPTSHNVSSTLYVPAIIDSKEAVRDNSNKVTTPFYETSFKVDLPKNQMLDLYFTVSGIRSHAESFYKADGYKAIDNKSHENGYNLYFSPSYSKKFNSKNSINTSLFVSYQRNKVDYMGNYERLFRSSQVSLGYFFQYSHKFGSRTSVSVNPGIVWEHSRLDDGKVDVDTHIYPRMEINLRHRWNKKTSMSFTSRLQNIGYPLGMKNGLTIRQTELLWKRGNPDLRSRLQWSNNFSNTWTPSRNYSLVSVVRYHPMYHADYKTWGVEEGYDGLISSLSDRSTDHRLTISQKFTARFFSRKLVLTGYASNSYLKTTGFYNKSKSAWGGWLAATWYGDSWYVSGNIVPEKTTYSAIGKVYSPWRYMLKFSYTINNLNLDLKVSDFLNTSKKGGISYIDTRHFSQKQRFCNSFAGPTFLLTLSYSVSYGKKVNESSTNAHGTSNSASMLIEE